MDTRWPCKDASDVSDSLRNHSARSDFSHSSSGVAKNSTPPRSSARIVSFAVRFEKVLRHRTEFGFWTYRRAELLPDSALNFSFALIPCTSQSNNLRRSASKMLQLLPCVRLQGRLLRQASSPSRWSYVLVSVTGFGRRPAKSNMSSEDLPEQDRQRADSPNPHRRDGTEHAAQVWRAETGIPYGSNCISHSSREYCSSYMPTSSIQETLYLRPCPCLYGSLRPEVLYRSVRSGSELRLAVAAFVVLSLK